MRFMPNPSIRISATAACARRRRARSSRRSPRSISKISPGRAARPAFSSHLPRSSAPSAGSAARRSAYRNIENPHISVTIGSLDEPERVQPAVQMGIESRMSWFSNAPIPAGNGDRYAAKPRSSGANSKAASILTSIPVTGLKPYRTPAQTLGRLGDSVADCGERRIGLRSVRAAGLRHVGPAAAALAAQDFRADANEIDGIVALWSDRM